MSPRRETLPVAHFEAIYAGRPDPWHYATSAYEQAKYAATLAALPRARYAHALEIGCAQGVFTALLAERCDALLAVEPVEAALAEARRRNAERSWVGFAPLFVPRDWPEETFDLILLSEVIDYLGEADLMRLAERIRVSLEPAGDLLMVHWVGKKRGPSSGQEASDRLLAALADDLEPILASRNPDYRMDVQRRR